MNVLLLHILGHVQQKTWGDPTDEMTSSRSADTVTLPVILQTPVGYMPKMGLKFLCEIFFIFFHDVRYRFVFLSRIIQTALKNRPLLEFIPWP